MLFIELFAPRGTLSQQARSEIGARLLTGVLANGGGPPAIIDAARSLAHVVVHEPEAWSTGAAPYTPVETPPFMVRVSVPAGHMTDSKRAEIIARVTAVLADFDDDPERLYREPTAWVQIVDLPDGAFGAFGRPMVAADVVKLVLEGAAPPAGASSAAAAEPTFLDPVCGMTVPASQATTLEHDGELLGFCCTGCRDAFLATHAHA